MSYLRCRPVTFSVLYQSVHARTTPTATKKITHIRREASYSPTVNARARHAGRASHIHVCRHCFTCLFLTPSNYIVLYCCVCSPLGPLPFIMIFHCCSLLLGSFLAFLSRLCRHRVARLLMSTAMALPRVRAPLCENISQVLVLQPFLYELCVIDSFEYVLSGTRATERI